MSPIALGTSVDDWEKETRPPLISDGNYEFTISKIEDSPVKATQRPQWKVSLQIINHSDTDPKVKVNGRSIDIYVQLPWNNPQTGQFDRSNTFTLQNILEGTKMMEEVKRTGEIPDKEFFLGKTGVMRVSHKQMPKQNQDDPDEEVRLTNNASIVVKRKGGGNVA